MSDRTASDLRRYPLLRRALCAPVTAALGVALLTGGIRPVLAQPSTQLPASILMFPRVVVDSAHDTVIQISNTSNMLVSALCLYLDGAACQQTNFHLDLAAQQTTAWLASAGRLDARNPRTLTPPVPQVFQGALFCVEVDASEVPLPGNAFIGTASLQDRTTGDIAQYNAVGLRGYQTNDGDQVLCLGGGVSPQCSNGAEYDACPVGSSLDFVAEGAEDSVVGAGSTVHTELSVLPCAQDFLSATVTSVLLFDIINEFEQRFSTSRSVSCLLSGGLNTIIFGGSFSFAILGTTYARMSVQTHSGQGMVVMAQEFHDAPGGLSSSVAVAPSYGAATVPGQIMLPPLP